jgi:geranylgeranyl reductase family protein
VQVTEQFDADVLVVGAGPAGSSSAFHLARRGLHILLVDRAVFPREKVCGDGLTPRAVRAMTAMGVGPIGNGFALVRGVRMHSEGGSPVEFAWPVSGAFPPVGLVRRRAHFDAALLSRAVDAGAEFLPGTAARRPVLDGGRVAGAVLSESGGHERTVRARWTIAADGASSRFAAQAGVRRRISAPVAIAARGYYRSTRQDLEFLEAFLTLRDGRRILPGYGWIFPMGGGVVNAGAYVVRRDGDPWKGSARTALSAFLAGLPLAWGIDTGAPVGPVGSAPIPMAVNREPLAVPGMLVVGDAGGIVNPFTGEGIAYAMESGELAARCIVRSIRSGDPSDGARYAELIRARYGRFFASGRWFCRAIGKPSLMRLGSAWGMRMPPLARPFLRAMVHVSG